jgi:ribonuclease P protein component
MQQTFTKTERLCSKKVLGELFKKGSTSGPHATVQTFYLFPFRVLYRPHPADVLPAENLLSAIVITVSKRNFKRAVDRNLVRRRIREAYRLNKHLFPADKVPPANIAFLYTAKQIISFDEIEKGMKLALRKL